jgi:hypothetical protein
VRILKEKRIAKSFVNGRVSFALFATNGRLLCAFVESQILTSAGRAV